MSEHSVVVREGLTFAEFDHEYLRASRPVIIRGAIDRWPAYANWTPEMFARRYAGRPVQCRSDSGPWTMDSYIEKLETSSPDTPLPYLRNVNIQTDFPELVPDIEPRVIYSGPDWLSSRLMPDNWPRAKNLNQLFISGRGARISLHYDDWMTHNMISNICGDKRFVFFKADQSDKLYRRGSKMEPNDYLLSAVDPWKPDLERFPKFKEAERIETVLRNGETLFIPAGWWHSSFTESTCISVSSSFANWSNWGAFVTEIGRLRQGSNPVKSTAMLAYLQAVGTSLGALRRVSGPV